MSPETAGPGSGPVDRRPFRPPRGVLQWATAGYLALLPVGMAYVVPYGGAISTLTDGLLAVLLAVGAATGLSALLGRGARAGDPGSGVATSPTAAGALALLLAFAAWALLSTVWSSVPDYALLKGTGYVALAAGASAVAWSGLGWSRALDAWLLGTGIALAFAFGAALVGPESWAARVTYDGGSVRGLPFARLSGPFPHPNGFGDYLVLSGVFLWARWPAWVARPEPASGVGGSGEGRSPWTRWAAYLGAAALSVALILTASTAHLALGVLLLVWGRRVARDARRGAGSTGASLRAVLLRGAGAALAGVVLAALLVPLRAGVGDLRIATSAIRPLIWASSLEAVLAAPAVGVGSAPYLAEAADPLSVSSGPALWDAHNVYLSVLGQFGAVGFVILTAALWLLVRHLRRGSPGGEGPDLAVVSGVSGSSPPGPALRHRARVALIGALLAMGVHGLAVAGEDLRHWWAVLGIAAMATSAGDAPLRAPE
ncbi:MAG: hypothetical protein GWM92_13320 [Gemmatimonadetes bacterium]|nr:O-antigen ligase family protein [Gemmatimonadota bacterium]NIR79689.1 O-antigen ligase family protein [Gemmatimonadota bacterium]NIT88397.1 O-antigen ligase family protein [Gemmatimonadota bacterium]NIU32210.1 O-antigen ligase family protein [Gemmatimonadota bacterium]NIU36755.1 hypothetical protein [Gemmatimonadota bacterium]